MFFKWFSFSSHCKLYHREHYTHTETQNLELRYAMVFVLIFHVVYVFLKWESRENWKKEESAHYITLMLILGSWIWILDGWMHYHIGLPFKSTVNFKKNAKKMWNTRWILRTGKIKPNVCTCFRIPISYVWEYVIVVKKTERTDMPSRY